MIVHRLRGDRYEPRDRSEVVPGLERSLLSAFVQPDEIQTRLAKAYLTALRAP